MQFTSSSGSKEPVRTPQSVGNTRQQYQRDIGAAAFDLGEIALGHI